MCGRYYFDHEAVKSIENLKYEIDMGLVVDNAGDIHPTDMAPIIYGSENGLVLKYMKWGLQAYQSKQLLINARAETVLEKKSFSEGIMRRRCIIPAQSFYEWDRQKNRVTFTLSSQPTIYMAGFRELYDDGEHFIIITTEANSSMKPVHNRMPLILSEEEMNDWLYDQEAYKEILKKVPPMLERKQEYEQMTLF